MLTALLSWLMQGDLIDDKIILDMSIWIFSAVCMSKHAHILLNKIHPKHT